MQSQRAPRAPYTTSSDAKATASACSRAFPLPPELFVPAELPLRAADPPFHRLLNRMPGEHGFAGFVESRCGKFYRGTLGRPSLAPGRHFRMLRVRGDRLRTRHRLAGARRAVVAGFIGYGLDETPAHHSTLSRTRRLIDLETHRELFGWVLKVLAENRIDGKTLGSDATTRETNAAMRSLVRRDDGRGYQQFRGDLGPLRWHRDTDPRGHDKGRKDKASNDNRQSPDGPDARIDRMKDDTTHLAHKAEHVVAPGRERQRRGAGGGAARGRRRRHPDDAAQPDRGDRPLRELADDPQTCDEIAGDFAAEVVADKGYHGNDTMTDLAELETRPYMSEPGRGRRNWEEKSAAQRATHGNRRRIRSTRGRDAAAPACLLFGTLGCFYGGLDGVVVDSGGSERGSRQLRPRAALSSRRVPAGAKSAFCHRLLSEGGGFSPAEDTMLVGPF